MKLVPVLLLFVACMSANAFVAPRSPVVEQVLGYIETFQRFLRELGLDPLDWEHREFEYDLIVPSLFSARATAVDVKFHGLTEIEIEGIGFDDASSTLTFKLKLEHIHLSGERARGQLNYFDRTMIGELSGRLDIRDIDIDATVVFNGLVAESAVVKTSLGGLECDARLIIHGQETHDLSDRLNYFVNTRIPRGIENYQDELDQMFAIYLVRFLNRNNEIEG